MKLEHVPGDAKNYALINGIRSLTRDELEQYVIWRKSKVKSYAKRMGSFDEVQKKWDRIDLRSLASPPSLLFEGHVSITAWRASLLKGEIKVSETLDELFKQLQEES